MTAQEMSRRDWLSVDFYAVLGVSQGAGRDEIERAFRERAKQLHPDRTGVTSADPSAERFKEVTAAYDVLGDPSARVRYDDLRSSMPAAGHPGGEGAAGGRAGVAPVPPVTGDPDAPARATAWRVVITPRRARQMLAGGIAALVLGVLSTALIVSLQRRDAAARAVTVAVTARRLPATGQIGFVTSSGERMLTDAPDVSGLGGGGAGSTMEVRYDPADPMHVVSAADTTARDITLWIVSVKLLVGGVAFTAVAARRLRRPPGPAAVRGLPSAAA